MARNYHTPKNPTFQDIATSEQLWNEYVDPQNNDPESFDRMTTAEKIQLMKDLWPQEE